MALVNGAWKPTSTARSRRAPEKDARGEPARILVVDDEPKFVDFIGRALSAQGFAVDTATDGARALELIQERDYELVVLDLLMEGVDGVTVLERTVQTEAQPPGPGAVGASATWKRRSVASSWGQRTT